MNIALWVGIGLLAGGAASRVLDDNITDTLFDIILGVVGAVFAGWLLYEFGSKYQAVDLFQVFTLLLGSICLIWIRNTIKSPYLTHQKNPKE